MIRLDPLYKRFGDVMALDGLALEARRGEVLALLGPNGAGKSTAIKCLVGLVHPDRGTVEVAGIDVQRAPKRARALIGYLPQQVNFYENLTPREVLAFFARLRQADPAQIPHLLETLGLASCAERRTVGFSGGMRQRLGLAVALLGDPPLLVLDEPTAGLDPEASGLFKRLIRERREAGGTVLVSSHLLAEIEPLADRIAVCARGRIVALDDLAALRHRVELPTRLILELDDAAGRPADIALERIARDAGAWEVEFKRGRLHAVIEDRQKAAMLRILEDRGARITDIRTEDASLEEIFLAIMARARAAENRKEA